MALGVKANLMGIPKISQIYIRQKIDKQRKWQKETHFIANKDGMLGLGVLYGQLGKFIVMLSICGMHHFCCFSLIPTIISNPKLEL